VQIASHSQTFEKSRVDKLIFSPLLGVSNNGNYHGHADGYTLTCMLAQMAKLSVRETEIRWYLYSNNGSLTAKSGAKK
jgi:hypothetical protein